VFDSSRLDRRSAAVVSLPAAIGHDCTDSRSSPVGESEKPHATMELSINRCTEIPLPSITLKFYNFGAVDRGWRSARPGFPARVTAHSEWPTNSDAAVASSARRSMGSEASVIVGHSLSVCGSKTVRPSVRGSRSYLCLGASAMVPRSRAALRYPNPRGDQRTERAGLLVLNRPRLRARRPARSRGSRRARSRRRVRRVSPTR